MAVFTTMTEVKNAQDRFKTLGNKKISKENNYFKETSNRLKSLMEKTRADEIEFYRKCKVENLEQLQQKIDDISSELNRFLNINSKDIIEEVRKLSFNKSIEDILNKPEIIQDFAKNKEVMEKCELDSVEFINFMNSFVKARGGKTKFIGVKKGKKVGLATFDFKVGFNKKNNSIYFKGELPQDWKKRIRNTFENTKSDENVKVKSSMIREALVEYITEKKFFKEETRSALVTEIYDLNYDVNISESSIKGFLGEVRNNTLFNLLFNGREAIPTGNIRIQGTGKLAGKEIGVDAVIRGSNFQIKNYSELEKGKKIYAFRGNMSAQNFIENRLKAESVVAEILLDFFGSAQYNQVREDINNTSVQKYKTVYNRFEDLSKDVMPKVMMRYIDNIIKVSDTFQAKENPQNLFLERNNYFNTFFVIDRYIIPSSYIINAIRVALRRKIENNRLFSINFGNNNKKSLYVSNSPTLYINGKKQEDTTTANELASKVKIDYSIKIYLNEIIEEAKRQIAKEKKIKIKG